MEIVHHSCVRASQESEDEEDEEEDDDDDDEEEEDDENGDSSEDGGDSSESSSEDESEDGDEVRRQHGGRGSWARGGATLPSDWIPTVFPRTRMTMTTRTTTRMTMRMKTTSLRAAAPAPPLQGTPQTLTPTKAHPPPGQAAKETLQSSLSN